mmetsp:Transcript_12150/g.19260  ORF Transcript_12150/g.19260 Transcript_12150/m.19260 type:complete len:88 (+) Transcript_12150:204-467(+)
MCTKHTDPGFLLTKHLQSDLVLSDIMPSHLEFHEYYEFVHYPAYAYKPNPKYDEPLLSHEPAYAYKHNPKYDEPLLSLGVAQSDEFR